MFVLDFYIHLINNRQNLLNYFFKFMYLSSTLGNWDFMIAFDGGGWGRENGIKTIYHSSKTAKNWVCTKKQHTVNNGSLHSQDVSSCVVSIWTWQKSIPLVVNAVHRRLPSRVWDQREKNLDRCAGKNCTGMGKILYSSILSV